jgi:peptidyl-prolyl cis-trans isomerase SurA
VELSIILVGSREDAEQLHGEVVSGQRSFTEAARKYSVGPGADAGGSLGEMALAELGAPIRSAVSGLSTGEVSDVFELAGQYAFVKLEGRESATAEGSAPDTEAPETQAAEAPEQEPSPDSVLSGLSDEQTEQLRKHLRERKLEERFQQYMTQLRDKAVIRVNL